MEKVSPLTAALFVVVLTFSHLNEISASGDDENKRQDCSEQSRTESCAVFCEKVGPREDIKCRESFPNGDFIDCNCIDKRIHGESSADCDQKIWLDCKDWCQYQKRQITICEYAPPQTNGSIPQGIHCFCHPIPSEVSNDLIYPVAITAVLLLVISVILACFGLWWCYQRSCVRPPTEQSVCSLLEVVNSQENSCNNGNAMDLALPSEFVINISDLEIDYKTVLGKGQFGMVLKAMLKQRESVAVKTLVESEGSAEDAKALLIEGKIQAHVGVHENIIKFFGAVTSIPGKNTVYLVNELCTLGDLNTYLWKNRQAFTLERSSSSRVCAPEGGLNSRQLILYSKQIASGMRHLEHKNVVHADLAARNVLVYDQNLVKISDFGLAQKLYKYTKCTKGSDIPLPLKWMATESLSDRIFTTKSDVWAYGVTWWEIFELGKVPYPLYNADMELARLILEGMRPEKPQFATNAMYEKMKACWDENPASRPTFEQMEEFFGSLFVSWTVVRFPGSKENRNVMETAV